MLSGISRIWSVEERHLAPVVLKYSSKMKYYREKIAYNLFLERTTVGLQDLAKAKAMRSGWGYGD